MRRDGVWFHDRGWPTDPLIPPVGDGRAALLLDRAARLFFLFTNVCARSVAPSMSDGSMSALGHKRTYAVQKGMSALPPKADIGGWLGNVRFVPITDIAPFRGASMSMLARAEPLRRSTIP